MRTATILHSHPSALGAFAPALCAVLLMAVTATPASPAKLFAAGN